MPNTIPSQQIGKQLDRDLKEIANAEDSTNNGLILYIRNGKIAFDTEENLFSIERLT